MPPKYQRLLCTCTFHNDQEQIKFDIQTENKKHVFNRGFVSLQGSKEDVAPRGITSTALHTLTELIINTNPNASAE